MNELIKKHHFESEKKKIQQFSNNTPSFPKFDLSKEKGFLPWSDHNVTGKELNGLISNLQNRLGAYNKHIKDIYDAFKGIYNTFDYLDKEYINAICTSVQAAEKASQQALSAQKDINETIEALVNTVDVLEEFKNSVSQDLSMLNSLTISIKSFNKKLENVEIELNRINHAHSAILKISSIIDNTKHFNNIDEIWSDIQHHKSSLSNLSEYISSINKNVIRLNEIINIVQNYCNHLKSYEHLNDVDSMWLSLQSHSSKIDNLNNFVSQLKNFKHLFDIDTIWDNLQEQSKGLKELNDTFNVSFAKLNETTAHINKDVENLNEYQQQLKSYAHLSDVDDLWNNVEKHSTELGNIQKQNEEIIQTLSINDKNLRNIIDAMKEKYAQEKVANEKRIKIAYYIAGSAVALTIGSLALQLTGLL